MNNLGPIVVGLLPALRKSLFTLALAVITTGTAHATAYTWTTTGGAAQDWDATNNTNWGTTSTFPVNAGDVANITANITANQTIGLDGAAITVGIINIGSANGSKAYTIATGGSNTGGTLTLNNNGAGAQINELSTSKGDTISASLTMADNLAISSAAANTFTLSGNISGTGNLTLTNTGAGAGNPALAMSLTGNITNAGNLLINDNGTGAITLQTGTVNNTGSITNSGTGTNLVTMNGVIGANVTGGITQNSTSSILSIGNSGNTFSGNVSVLAGTLLVGGGGDLGATATNTVLLGATSGGSNTSIQISTGGGFQTVANKIIVQSGNSGTASIGFTAPTNNANGWSGSITLGTAGSAGHGVTLSTLSPTGSGATFSGIIQDATGATSFGAVTISSAGLAVTLSGANTFHGGVNLIAGNLIINNATALGASTSIFTINGGNLVQTGTVTMTANNAQVWDTDFSYTGAFSLNMGTGTVNLGATPGAASRTVTVNTGGTLTVGHATGGTNGTTNALIKNGNGALVLQGSSTYTGGTTINAGILQFGTAAPTTGTIVINGAGTFALNSSANGAVATTLGSGSIATTSTGGIALIGDDNENLDFTSTFGGNSYNLSLGAFANSTYTGTITPTGSTYRLGGGGAVLTLSNANALTGSNNLVVGNRTGLGLLATTGTVALSNSNNITGTTTVKAGTLNLATQAGTIASSDVTVNNATLAIDNTVGTPPASVTRAKSVTLQGGTLTVAGTGTANSDDVITNALTLDSGFSTITVTPNGSKGAELSAASLSQSANAFALVNGVNLGAAAIGTAGDGNIIFTTAPSSIGTTTLSGSTGTDTTKNVTIVPYLVGAVGTIAGNPGTASSVPNTFVTYDSTRGLRPLDLTNEFTNNAITTGNNIYVNGTTAGTAAASTTNINSLLMLGAQTAANSTLTINSGVTLTDSSGAILIVGVNVGNNSTTATIAAGDATSALAFGTQEAIITVNPNLTSTQTNTGIINTLVTGSGGLAKLGTGILDLAGNNTYTGTTTIISGTLQAANNNALGADSSAILLGATSGSANAELDINDGGARTIAFSRNIVVQAGNTGTATIVPRSTNFFTGVSDSGSITLGSGGIGHNLTISNAPAQSFQNSTFSGVIQDPSLGGSTPGVVTFLTAGSNTIILPNANTYTGGTILSSSDGTGGVSIGNANAFGSGVITATGSAISASGAIALANNIIVAGNFGLGASTGNVLTINGTVSLTGNYTITSGGNGNAIFNGVISDSATGANNTLGLNSINFGSTITLAGLNTYGGGTIFGANGSTFSGTVNINNLGTSSTASALGTGAVTINVPLTLVSSASGTLSTNNAEVWNSDFTYNSSANSLNMGTGAVSLGTAAAATRTITVNNGGSFETDGVISNGTNSVTPTSNLTFSNTSSGNFILGGANTFTGNTTVSGAGAGKLILANTLALQNSTLTTGGIAFSSTVGSHAFTFGALTGSGNITLADNAGSPNPVALSVGNNNSSPAAYSGVLSGAGSLNKIGTGTEIISGANTYTGTTTISQGTLAASNVVVSAGSSNLGNAGSAVVLGGASTTGILSYTGNNAAYTRGFTVGAGGGEVDTTTAGQTLTIQTGNIANTSNGLFTVGGAGNTTISSVIGSGSGGLTKTGAGKLTLSGATGNTYSGATSVNAGTMLITNTSGSATGSGALSVVRGAALAGTGTSSGSSFAIGGTSGSGTASVYVGQTAATGDTNTTNNLTLIGSGASTIANANLTFNLNTTAGGGNELLVGSTAITFGSGGVGVNPVTLTLNLQGGGTGGSIPYFVLIAGTAGNGTLGSTQYAGLSFGTQFAADGGFLTPITNSTVGGSGNLILALNLNGSPNFYGGQAGLYLYQTAGGVDDIVVIPEPGTWVLMLGGLALLIFWQRRKSKLN